MTATLHSARVSPSERPLPWQHDALVKSFFEPQTEMKQTDAQRLMFSWKRTEIENIFGDEIAETTTYTVLLHNIVCDQDVNTNTMTCTSGHCLNG